MNCGSEAPLACTLQGGDYEERLAWIAELARDGLLDVRREALRLDLRYSTKAAERVRDMVRKEQECCAFLDFELSENEEGLRLTITAPERARDVATVLFEQFVPDGVRPAGL
jgi:hypothetical protein